MATAVAAVAAGTLPGASATGDVTVTVRGADFAGLARTHLNVVGCSSVFARSGQAPRPAIGVVPGGPAGKRSLALAAAAGDAVGPVGYASSLAATPPAAMSVRAEQAMTGVGYVGYQAPGDVGTNRMWVGRVELPVAAGTWTDVSLADAALTWIQYDMGSRQQLAGPVAPTTVAAFTASQGGDGYGFYSLGFGCEGVEFNTDAWRVGVAGGTTTYDFEGYAATVTGGGDRAIDRGGSVTLTAQVTSDGRLPRLVLEQQDADGQWGAAPQQPQPGTASVVVSPQRTTTYRWKIYSTPGVEAVQARDRSEPFTITVAAPATDLPADEAPDQRDESDGQGDDGQSDDGRDRKPDRQREKAPQQAPATADPAPAADPAPPAASGTEPAPAAPAPETSAPAAPATEPAEPTTPGETPGETPAG